MKRILRTDDPDPRGAQERGQETGQEKGDEQRGHKKTRPGQGTYPDRASPVAATVAPHRRP
jgi:hypothetical protein